MSRGLPDWGDGSGTTQGAATAPPIEPHTATDEYRLTPDQVVSEIEQEHPIADQQQSNVLQESAAMLVHELGGDEKKIERAFRHYEAIADTPLGEAIDAMPPSVQTALAVHCAYGLNSFRLDSLLKAVANARYVTRDEAKQAGEILSEFSDEELMKYARQLRGL